MSQELSSKCKLDKATFSNNFTSARVGNKIIDSQQGRVCYDHLVSNEREWNDNYCFIKNNIEKSLNLADLVIVFFSPDAYSCHICGVWYNGSYAVAGKPIRTVGATDCDFSVRLVQSIRPPLFKGRITLSSV